MIRFSHEANSWQYLIEYKHFPNLNHWVDCSPIMARICVDSGWSVDI